jgi:hypothetical protein
MIESGERSGFHLDSNETADGIHAKIRRLSETDRGGIRFTHSSI